MFLKYNRECIVAWITNLAPRACLDCGFALHPPEAIDSRRSCLHSSFRAGTLSLGVPGVLFRRNQHQGSGKEGSAQEPKSLGQENSERINRQSKIKEPSVSTVVKVCGLRGMKDFKRTIVFLLMRGLRSCCFLPGFCSSC